MIIGYTFDSIEAKREKELQGRVDISSTQKIVSVEEKEVVIGEKRKVLEIGFEFLVEYKENFGSILMKGKVLYDSKDMKEILKNWKKDQNLPQEVDMEVKNFLFKKCLTLAILIADELRLPSPLPFPMVVPKKEERYIG
ncbi:MAG: hypothetical protein ACP5F8_01040 [Candidatus Aenigmatarchaeota archaeon]|jgi:hypothetical protein